MGDAEHVRRRKGPDVLELALEEGVGPQEGVGRRGGREAPSNNPTIKRRIQRQNVVSNDVAT